MARKTRKTTRAVVLNRSRSAGQTRLDRLLDHITSADPETRCQAALSLGRLGGPEALEPLEAAALGDDLDLAACARTGLALLAPRLDQDKTTPIKELKSRLGSPYVTERIGAFRALAARSAAEALPHLVPVLEVETDRRALCVLILAIGRLDDGTHRGALLKLLKHREDAVRAAALETVWHVQDTEIGHAAIALARDPSEKVRASAIILLVRRAQDTSRAMAERVLASNRQWMRLTALFALGGMSEPWARTMLIQHIRDISLPPLVRALAREAVGIVGAGRPPEPAGNETVYTDLTRHLQSLPDAAAIQAALGSADPLQRVHALQNSKRFANEQMLPLVVRLVDFETDPLVLATLVKALGRLGGTQQVAAIRGFLEHTDERVRANAVEAMALANPGAELDTLLKGLLAEDEGPRLRKQAAAQLFASNPVAALDHFRGLVLGADVAARAGALSIISAVQDDRLCEVLREALKDQRREVYEPVIGMLSKIGSDWSAAHELLAAFRRGEVAGEVIEDRAVGALLSCEMNSPRSADRVRAMGLLANAKDPRVATVLELNLSSRDPEVAHVASRVLRDRHRTMTLPALYQKLGEVYGDRSRAGELVVPQDVADRLPPGELGGEEEEDPDRLRWLGKSLYDAFDDDVELDAELRQLCLEVRSALEQLGSIISPVSRPERVAATNAMMRRSQLGLEASGIAARPPREALEDAPVAAPARSWGPLVVVGLVLILGVSSFFSDGGAEDVETTAGATDSSTRMLDAMALENNPDRFRERFRGRSMNVVGRIVSVGDSHALDLRSGTVLFRVRKKGGALPAGLRIGQSCEVQGSVADMDADGSITLDATQAVVSQT